MERLESLDFCKKKDEYMYEVFEEDDSLLLEANKRLKNNKRTIPIDVILKNLGISEDEINSIKNLDIEWDSNTNDKKRILT